MNRKGFTLIELLIVVVIIGILAAIAIPKFANTKEKAYIASMKSDLRNLVTAEEAYFADSVKYTAAYGAGGVNFVQSTGNTTPAVTTTADRSEEHRVGKEPRATRPADLASKTHPPHKQARQQTSKQAAR